MEVVAEERASRGERPGRGQHPEALGVPVRGSLLLCGREGFALELGCPPREVLGGLAAATKGCCRRLPEREGRLCLRLVDAARTARKSVWGPRVVVVKEGWRVCVRGGGAAQEVHAGERRHPVTTTGIL